MPPPKVVRVTGYVVEFDGSCDANPRALFKTKEEAEAWATRMGVPIQTIVKVDGFAHVDSHLKVVEDASEHL